MTINGAAKVLVAMVSMVVVVGLVVGAAVLAPPASAATAIQPDRDVEFVSGGVTIHASYRAPASGAANTPAAVIIGGTGDVDRDGNSPLAPGVAMDEYRWLADRLSAQGVASIRYDKVGTGATGLGPYESDPSAMLALGYDELRVQPARDALAFLAGQPGIDSSRLIVVGHSEGGAVALAVDHDPRNAPRPAGVALVEPAYTHILDILDRQFTSQIQGAVDGGAMTAPDAATLTSWLQAGINEIRTGSAPFPAPGPVPLPDATDFTALMQSTIESNIYGSDPAQMVLTHSFRTRYGKEYDAIDPAVLAGSVKVPTLITCGTKDFNTPCGPGAPAGSGVIALASAFAPGIADLVVLPDTVHILRDVGDDNPVSLADQATYPFSPELAAAFDAFVAGFVTVPAPAPVPSATVVPSFTG